MLRLVSAGGIEEFQWSSEEQVWPFEKASDGSTLYCKEIDMDLVPNNGISHVSHSISGLDLTKVFKLAGELNSPSNGSLTLPHVQKDGAYSITFRLIGSTLVELVTYTSYWFNMGYKCKARLLYSR